MTLFTKNKILLCFFKEVIKLTKKISAEEIVKKIKETGEIKINPGCICEEPVKISNVTLEKIVVCGGIFKEKLEIDETVIIKKDVLIEQGCCEKNLIITGNINGNIFITNKLLKYVSLRGYLKRVTITSIESSPGISLMGSIREKIILSGTFENIFADTNSEIGHLLLHDGCSAQINLSGRLRNLEIIDFDIGKEVYISCRNIGLDIKKSRK